MMGEAAGHRNWMDQVGRESWEQLPSDQRYDQALSAGGSYHVKFFDCDDESMSKMIDYEELSPNDEVTSHWYIYEEISAMNGIKRVEHDATSGLLGEIVDREDDSNGYEHVDTSGWTVSDIMQLWDNVSQRLKDATVCF